VPARRRRAAVGALAAAALLAGCSRRAAPATSGAAGGVGSGSPDASADGGKGPGAPVPLGPGGDTVWLATVTGPYADLAQSVAAAPDGGVVVALAQGSGTASADDLTILRVAGDGTAAAPRRFSGSCGVAGTMLGVSLDGTAFAEARTACSAIVPGLGPDPVPPSGALLAFAAGGGDATAVAVDGSLVGGAMDAQGRLVVLESGGTRVEALDAAGLPAWQVALVGGQLVAPAPAGGVVVGATPAGAPALLLALDATGAERWRLELPGGFDLRHLAVLSDGAVAVTGVLLGELAFGSGQAGSAGARRQAVLALEPDGAPRTLATVDDATPDDPTVQVAALPHGRALLFAFPGCDRLRGLSPQLEPVWARTLDSACGAAALGAALTTSGRIAVVGAFRGQADFGGGFVATAQGTSQDGFVLGLAP
jgi:hypothetical protein